MRRIGTLTNEELARRFADYLFTQSIECSVDVQSTSKKSPDSGGGSVECDLWIRDERHVDRARQELDAFQADPDAEAYRVGQQAEQKRQAIVAEEQRKKKLVKQVKHRSPPGTGPLMGVSVRQQSIPVVITVIVLSVIASFSTGFGRPARSLVPGELSSEQAVFYALSFVDARDYVAQNEEQSEDPFASIKKGQIWRLITPIFLHGDTYHLAFNMLGLFFLGSAIERLQGSAFMAFLLLASGIFGGLVQVFLPPEEFFERVAPMLTGLAGTPFSIGASGAVYGLFGYLWVRPLLSPSYPIRMMPNNILIMMGWLVFCIFFVERIANGAHIGVLVAGVVIAAAVAQLTSKQST